MELRYLRDTDRREVDFVVLQNQRPLFAVECKYGERAISPHLRYFKARTPIPQFYQVHAGTTHRAIDQGIHAMPFAAFCREVDLV